MKRLLSILLLISVLLLAFAGCAPSDGSDDGGKKDKDPDSVNFKRLKRVTVTYEGETVVCNVSWDENVCNFESYMDYFKDPIENYKGIFDPESKKFSILWLSNDIELPVFIYDDDQKITEIFNEDKPTESWKISYDKNGVPSLDTESELFTYDADTKTVTRSKGQSLRNDNGVITRTDSYREYIIGKDGRFEKVTYVAYTAVGDAEPEKSKEIPDYEKYSYDDDGNLIKYERHDGSCVIEFEYYDEAVSHNWERVIPIHYIDIFDIYVTPLTWYLK